MRARVPLILLAAATVVGCGPATPTGEPTDGVGTAKLDGIWVATKVDVPEGRTAFPQGGLEQLVAMVKEGQVPVRIVAGADKILSIETEDTKTSKVLVGFATDEKWDVTAKEGVTFHTAGQKAGAVGLWPHPRGVLKVVGDTATIAISPEPESSDQPRVNPEEGSAMVVFHLKRVKDIPKPPPPPPAQRPTFPSTVPAPSATDK